MNAPTNSKPLIAVYGATSKQGRQAVRTTRGLDAEWVAICRNGRGNYSC